MRLRRTLGPRPCDAPARQRTLAATLRRSYVLLTPAEQTAVAFRCSAGGCTREPAGAVTAARLDVIEPLVAKNLVVDRAVEAGPTRIDILEGRLLRAGARPARGLPVNGVVRRASSDDQLSQCASPTVKCRAPRARCPHADCRRSLLLFPKVRFGIVEPLPTPGTDGSGEHWWCSAGARFRLTLREPQRIPRRSRGRPEQARPTQEPVRVLVQIAKVHASTRWAIRTLAQSIRVGMPPVTIRTNCPSSFVRADSASTQARYDILAGAKSFPPS
jgi:hypothetical protein